MCVKPSAGSRTTHPVGTLADDDGASRLTAETGTANGSYSYAGSTADELTAQTVPGGTTLAYVYGRPDTHGVPVLDSVTKAGQSPSYVIHDPDGAVLVVQTTTAPRATTCPTTSAHPPR